MSIQQNSLRHTSMLIQTSRDCSTQSRNPSSPNMLMMTQSPTFSKYSKLMRRLLVLKASCKDVKTFDVTSSDTKQTRLLTLTGLIHTYLTNCSEFTLQTLTAQTETSNTKYTNWEQFPLLVTIAIWVSKVRHSLSMAFSHLPYGILLPTLFPPLGDSGNQRYHLRPLLNRDLIVLP